MFVLTLFRSEAAATTNVASSAIFLNMTHPRLSLKQSETVTPLLSSAYPNIIQFYPMLKSLTQVQQLCQTYG